MELLDACPDTHMQLISSGVLVPVPNQSGTGTQV